MDSFSQELMLLLVLCQNTTMSPRGLREHAVSYRAHGRVVPHPCAVCILPTASPCLPLLAPIRMPG